MRRSISRLLGCSVHARDGELGAVDDFYFDDQGWVIRYMVVNTGGWLSGREVLISTSALKKPRWKARAFPVDLTKRQVKDSPGIDTHRPVSRQHEDELHAYYGWPVYWGSPLIGLGIPMPMATPPIPLAKPARRLREDTHLRSTQQVSGYYIKAKDGEIGHVQDFIVDDATWAIRFIVVNTRNWLPGKQVLISPHWIRSVNWMESVVSVRLSRSDIANSPVYDPSRPVTVGYQARLLRHYESRKRRGVPAGVS
jgi:uncharacterized protein YrrD